MKEQIKELRVKIDGLYQLTKELKPITGLEEQIVIGSNIVWDKKAPRNSKQIEDAAHSLIYAKAWLGKCLGELGEENPYKSGYKTVADIEPTADKSGPVVIFEDFNHIQKVDWLRTEIQKIIEELTKWYTHSPTPTREFNIARTNAYNHLCEARFALGFELEKIKKENK
jgi:hypothetical protein